MKLFEITANKNKEQQINWDCWNYIYAEVMLEYPETYKADKRCIKNHGAMKKFNALSDTQQKELLADNPFVEKLTISDDGVLTSSSYFSIYHYDQIGAPPFKIGKVKEFELGPAKTLTELPDWFPPTASYIQLKNVGITSLHNVHKVIKQCRELRLIDVPVTSCFLGLLKIEGLLKFSFDPTQKMINDHPVDGIYNKLDMIINKHLKNGRNLFDCQAELEDAGFEEYAKL